MFYPKGLYEQGKEIKIFDDYHDALPAEAIYKQIRNHMDIYNQ